MIVTHMKLPLEQFEYSALLKIAGSELRNPADQARIILRAEFERRGLIFAENKPSECRPEQRDLQAAKKEPA